MTLETFHGAPWRNSHPTYRDSALALTPAPEYASSEVLLASLYRHAGMGEAPEREVPQAGRDLDRKAGRMREKGDQPDASTLDGETFHSLLHGVLESPKLPNQSSKRFVQIAPLVPGATSFSGSARLSANSWPAGSLLRRMVWLGSASEAEASETWKLLFEALSVHDDDDFFARWLQQELTAWTGNATWQVVFPEGMPLLGERDRTHAPARQFATDLRAIIAAKSAITRRQWTSLLEAIIRLAAVAHVNWVCDVQARIGRLATATLAGDPPPDFEEAASWAFPSVTSYFHYGDKALSGVKDRTSGYLRARLEINYILWALHDAGAEYPGTLSSSEDVADFCAHITSHRALLQEFNLVESIGDLVDREARSLLCKKGIGSNIQEFARHVLGQRQTANPVLRGYDQGYVLRKRGVRANSPWVVSLGPVSVLAIVHCCLFGLSGPRSVHRLSQHLARYGLVVDRNDISQNDLGHQLRMLGLVLDSPDAESGMLLTPPFPPAQVAGNQL